MLILDDIVKPGRGTSPDIWAWYQDYLASKAATIDAEVRPCVPVDCPPVEDVEMRPWSELVTEWLADVESQAAVIEIACEQALTSGYMGVRATRTMEQRPGWVMVVVEAQATPDVPYGYIHWGPPHPMGIAG